MVRLLLGCEQVALRFWLQIIYIDLATHEKSTTDFIHAELKIYPIVDCLEKKNPNNCKKEKEGLSSSDNTEAA